MSDTLKYYINAAIVVAIMALFRFIPAPDPITPLGMTVLGIFIGCIYGWCTCSMIWPSILGIIFFAFTGVMTPLGAWSFFMSQPAIVIGLWLMIACGLLVNSGVANYLANWSVTRKFTEGKPWLFISIIYWADILVAAIIGSVGAVLIFWALIYGICKQVGWEKGEKTPAWMVFSIVIFAITGCFLFPFQMVVITNFGFLAAGSGGAFDGTFNYLAYMTFAFINQILIFTVFMLASKYIFRIDLNKLKNYKADVELPELTKKQKTGLVLFIALFVLLMLPCILPKGTLLYGLIMKLDTVGICFLITMLACFVRVDGKPFVTFGDLVTVNVKWEVILMFGTALTLASVVNSDASGIILWIKELLGPMLTNLSPLAYVAVLMLVAMVLTNLINNVVVSAILMPISWTFSTALGVNPIAIAALFTAFVDYAIILPSSSPVGALLYSNEEWIKPKTIMLYGAVSFALFYIVSVFIGWPLVDMLF